MKNIKKINHFTYSRFSGFGSYSMSYFSTDRRIDKAF